MPDLESPETESRNSAGELLRQGRLRQRLSIVECSKRTHIAQRYIEALEEERWADLPSESHRQGFLKLYARFLGVSVEEVLQLYQKKTPAGGSAMEPSTKPSPSRHVDPQGHAAPSETRKLPTAASSSSGHSRWAPISIPQIVLVSLILFFMAWLVYHALLPRLLEQNPMPWVHRRATHQARLEVPKSSIPLQKVNIKAVSDSWLRVTSRKELLYEGILPKGASKEWTGPGPFQFKVGNVNAITLFWNDQPVDIGLGAHGPINDIRIPPQ